MMFLLSERSALPSTWLILRTPAICLKLAAKKLGEGCKCGEHEGLGLAGGLRGNKNNHLVGSGFQRATYRPPASESSGVSVKNVKFQNHMAL